MESNERRLARMVIDADATIKVLAGMNGSAHRSVGLPTDARVIRTWPRMGRHGRHQLVVEYASAALEPVPNGTEPPTISVQVHRTGAEHPAAEPVPGAQPAPGFAGSDPMDTARLGTALLEALKEYPAVALEGVAVGDGGHLYAYVRRPGGAELARYVTTPEAVRTDPRRVAADVAEKLPAALGGGGGGQ